MPQILKSPISLGPGMTSGCQSCKNLTPSSTQMKLALPRRKKPTMKSTHDLDQPTAKPPLLKPPSAIIASRRASSTPYGMRVERLSARPSYRTSQAALVTGRCWKSSTVRPTDFASAALVNGKLGTFCHRAARSPHLSRSAMACLSLVRAWRWSSALEVTFSSSRSMNKLRCVHSEQLS
eukprot:scaffold42434_cov60-Phaeocystis_antarctica.AAC.5